MTDTAVVLDSSALIAILYGEPATDRLLEAIDSAGELLISAGTLAEAHIVAARRGIGRQMVDLLDALAPEVVPVTAETAYRLALAYDSWGKGVHASGLNFGDCFAYVLAKDRGLPLLYVGTDFARTDVITA